MTHPLVEYFRCPEHFAVIETGGPLPADEGYFRFGDAICYGRQAVGASSPRPDGSLVDVSRGVSSAEGRVLLPFDLSEVLTNLRYERYPTAFHYPRPVHLQECYRAWGYREGSLPVTEQVAGEVLSLPMYPGLASEQQQRIAECVATFVPGATPRRTTESISSIAARS